MTSPEATDLFADVIMPVCSDCAGFIGGACSGPDAEWRLAWPGEACQAADHDELSGGPDTITQEISRGRQTVTFAEVLRCDNGAKLRIVIKSDSYDFQSSAKVSLWDGAAWQFAHGIHYSQMATPSGLWTSASKVSVGTFRADRDELIRVASALMAP